MNARFLALLATVEILAAVPALTRQKPASPGSSQGEARLERTFYPGAETEYRIQLSVRSDLAGEQPELIGAKAYVHPFFRSVGERVTWRATSRVISAGAGGSAEIEETLDNFGAVASEPFTAGDPEAEKLDEALHAVLTSWASPRSRTLRYHESRNGQLAGLDSAGVPLLEEARPPLLTLWLLRALRPAAALPARPVVFGDRWQEPRAAKLEGWSEVEGFESGGWLTAPEFAPTAEPAARLLLVQQIVGKITAGPEKPPEGAARGSFHGESLATISLNDGRVLAATRSATREASWTLAPVAGLDHAPEFRARLAAQVEIEECHGPCP